MTVVSAVRKTARIQPPRKDEPKVRRDGRCLICLGERPEAAVKMGDPFCKTQCAKAYYGTEEASSAA